MAYRKGRQPSFPAHIDKHAPSNVDQLTVKYMEMCKVGSSTDSDSEISSRWPETSTGVCPRGAAEPETSQQMHKKPSRSCVCYSLLLDPYDGSSEDSESNVDVSSRKTRQRKNGGAGFPFSSQRRRSVLNQTASVYREMLRNEMRDGSDVQMKYHSDSDLWNCESNDCKMITEESESHSLQHIHSMDKEFQLGDSGLYGPRSSTPLTPGLLSSAESSCKFKSLWKRKVNFSPADVVDLRPRKKQCVVTTEEEKE